MQWHSVEVPSTLEKMPKLIATGLSAAEFDQCKQEGSLRTFKPPFGDAIAPARAGQWSARAQGAWEYGPEECDPAEAGEPSPELAASFIAQVSLSWIYPILQQGTKKTLDFCDIYELAPDDRCAFSASKIASAWEREVASASKKLAKRRGGDHNDDPKLSLLTSLFRTILIRAFGADIAKLALLRAVCIISTYAQPVVLELFVSSVDAEAGANPNGARYTLALALALFALALTSAALDTAYSYRIGRLATRNRLGLQRFLIAKALRLSGKSRRGLGVGAIISHLQMDARLVSQAIVYVNMAWGIPAQLLLCLFLLYRQLGTAAFAGLAVTGVLAPLIFIMTRYARTYRRQVMKRRDKRIKFLTELLQGAKTIKMFAWEIKVRDELATLRATEIHAIRATQLCSCATQFLAQALPTFVAVATFAVYTSTGEADLTPARAFSSLALLGLLSTPLAQIPTILTSVIGGRVSATRLNAYLHAEEFAETVVERPEDLRHSTSSAISSTSSPFYAGGRDDAGSPFHDEHERRRRYIRYLGTDGCPTAAACGAASGARADAPISLTGTYTWPSVMESEDSTGQSTCCAWPGKRPPAADAASKNGSSTSPGIRDVKLSVPRGSLLVVVGRVGAGKSSLLAALLNELEADGPHGKAALRGRVAFVGQEPWIRNKPLQDNILFGQPLHAGRYASVIDACALAPDIAQLPDGDQTQIGERGLNLSGGQKARVALARALYADVDLYLLDDVLAAVDQHTSASLLEKLLLRPNGILRTSGKTVVLVTNRTDWIHHADLVLVLGGSGSDCGKVLAFGSPEELAAAGIDPAAIASEDAMTAGGSGSAETTNGSGGGTVRAGGRGHGPKGKGGGKGKGKGKRAVGKWGEGGTSLRSSGLAEKSAEDGSTSGSSGAADDAGGNGGLGDRKEGPAAKGSTVEQRERGAVSSHIWFLYSQSLGLQWMLLVFFFYAASQLLRTAGDYVLAVWSSADGRPPAWIRIWGPLKASLGLETVDLHLISYAGLLLASAAAVLARSVSLVMANIRAAQKVHNKAMWAVLRSPMGTCPVCRITPTLLESTR